MKNMHSEDRTTPKLFPAKEYDASKMFNMPNIEAYTMRATRLGKIFIPNTELN
jgi:hypothetical protein